MVQKQMAIKQPIDITLLQFYELKIDLTKSNFLRIAVVISEIAKTQVSIKSIK